MQNPTPTHVWRNGWRIPLPRTTPPPPCGNGTGAPMPFVFDSGGRPIAADNNVDRGCVQRAVSIGAQLDRALVDSVLGLGAVSLASVERFLVPHGWRWHELRSETEPCRGHMSDVPHRTAIVALARCGDFRHMTAIVESTVRDIWNATDSIFNVSSCALGWFYKEQL